jgi:hypothetical protein
MDAIKNFFQRNYVIAGAALLIGIALGVLYAWQINPVQWVDGEPHQLRQDLQVDYMRMAIDSYSVNLDAQLAKERYEGLGAERGNVLAEVGKEPGEVNPAEIQKFRALVEIESPTLETEEPSGTTAAPATSGVAKYIVPVCGTTRGLGGLLAAALLLRRRLEGRQEEEIEGFADLESHEAFEPEVAQPVSQPLATFRTTYTYGDDLYDDSFSIESPSGDFLGECGVGVGDVMGVGEPKKVSAFEVWLFDKNDIQTVTKVLLSPYTFADETIFTRLSAKGDPMKAESGSVVTLETNTLRVEARIVDMNFGEGPLPEQSFFDRITIEMQAWPYASDQF